MDYRIRKNINLTHALLCLTPVPFTIGDAVKVYAKNYPTEYFSQQEIITKLNSLKESGAVLQFNEGYVPRGTMKKQSNLFS